MSQEFEKIVLEKLDHFENRFDKIEKTLDEHTEEFKKVNKILDEHTEEFKKVNKILDEHTNLIQENRKAIENNTKLIQKNSREIEGLTEVVMSHTEAISKNNNKLDLIMNAVEVHKNLFIQFEHEFNLKFNVLMDFFSMNQEKHEKYDEILLHYNSKLLNHDIKILELEDNVKQNSKTA